MPLILEELVYKAPIFSEIGRAECQPGTRLLASPARLRPRVCYLRSPQTAAVLRSGLIIIS